ncbi:heat shock factor protein [Caerostris extrusa]|uniref:Heat shock factor protein n=1 Tax=Caerostris extrusa TaxID=172846 RepID=A0AAV4PJC5_CAEEX|nr:heat shock factor protein [Caerostris extrusa]
MHSFDSNSSNVPAFLIKLWKLVEDPTCDDLIAWSESGFSFIIRDQARFAKELLPQYFKHNNMASFVRQLNMYGFKKVMNYEKVGLRNENTEMEFQHGFFIKERGELLELIKRKISNPKVPEPVTKSNAKDILVDLSSIREKQESMDNMLSKMKKENELLWRELTSMRQKHKAQEQIIQKVIQFLVSIVQRSGNQNLGVGVQRKITRMLHGSPNSKASSSQVSRTIDVLRNKNSECILVPDQIVSPLGPVIHEVTDGDHEEANSVSATKPAVIHLVGSPGTPTEANEKNQYSASNVPNRNCPENLTVPMEQLGILEALHQSATETNNEGTNPNESILGLPLEYITNPTNSEIVNVISIPEDSIGNVISIPEGSSISDIIPISRLENVISLPETKDDTPKVTGSTDSPCDNILTGSGFFNASDIAAFNELQASTLKESDSSQSNLPKSDLDNFLSESLHTPKVNISDEDAYNPLTAELIRKNEAAKKEKMKTASKIIHNEHDYQLAKTKPSSSNLVKNALCNHLLSIDEKINNTQEQLSSNWNIDVTNLFRSSSDDLVNYDFTNNFSDEMNIKQEGNDISGTEIIQYTPIDIENTPLFEALNEDADGESNDFNYNVEPLSDALKETSASEAAKFLTDTLLDSTSPKRRKNSKSTKTKRRKMK